MFGYKETVWFKKSWEPKKVAPSQLYIALPLNFLLVSSHELKVLPSVAASIYNKLWVIYSNGGLCPLQEKIHVTHVARKKNPSAY